jgi:hypothetical protein
VSFWNQIAPALVLRALTLSLMLVGLVVIPFLPGLLLIWGAALAYGILSGFGVQGWICFALMTAGMITASVLENVLMSRRARRAGAPWWAILLALIATLLGTFLIPIPIIGGILAGILTLFLIEWARSRDWRRALASMKAMLVGWGWAFAIRLIMGVVMIGLWVVWAGV